MKYEQIKAANETILTTDIQGKKYAEVNQRIKAFRMCYPDGCIQTDILSIENGVVIFRASVFEKAGGALLATGTAYEKEGSTFINKTSYIENCETSAIGRALGIAGFGIDTSVASAEEVQNAIANQNSVKPAEKKSKVEASPKATPEQLTAIRKAYGEEQVEKMLGFYKLEKLEDMPAVVASGLVKKIKDKERTQQ